MQNDFVLIHLDDDPLELKSFSRLLQKNVKEYNFEVHSFSTVMQFNSTIKKLRKIDFAILDIHLTDESQQSGISLVEKLRIIHPETTILMSSNLDDPESVLQSLRAGADEFISKKMKIENIIEKILGVRNSALLKRGMSQSKISQKEVPHFSGKTMQKIAARIPQIINSAVSSVYIEGESGTGKEVVADFFANYGLSFLKINCGSISPSLLESELFGYKKGAFTGALIDKAGLIETASGGWLFLDEIASLSPSAQVAILRVLENQEVIRIGESHARKINLRFIAASNVPLSECVLKGTFRNDLWQRLCETEIFLPPLRERKNEIPDFISFFCRMMRGGPYKIEETAQNVLCQLPWNDGNVRELRNCLRAMTEHHNNGILSPLGIPERILVKPSQKKNNLKNDNIITVCTKNHADQDLSYSDMCDLLLKDYIKKNFPEDINISQIAKKLKMARSTLHLKLKKLL